jgi:hypothetical protein
MSTIAQPDRQPAKMLPADYLALPDGEREDALYSWAQDIERAVEEQQGEDFKLLNVDSDSFFANLLYTRACTSLSDEDATARINLVPSGTSNGWVLCTGEQLEPVPCSEKPGFRHLMWEC